MSDDLTYDVALRGDIVSEDGSVIRDGWIGVSDGRIGALSERAIPARTVHDARGKLLMPGFVDVHVHTRSSVEEGIEATTRSAAAGGTTTVVDMPYDNPSRPVNTPNRLAAKVADVGREAIVDVGLYATFPPEGSLDVIGQLAEGGAIGFKVSTIEVDPVRFPRIPDGRLVEAFQEVARTGLLIAAHQENQDISDHYTGRARKTAPSAAISHAHSRPPVAEAEAAGRLLEFAYWTGAHLHMVHGTIPRTFNLINWNRANGVAATGETCIHYLLLDEQALTRLGGRAKCNPPLRNRDSVEELWRMLDDREVDIVTSDHSPYPLSLKETPSIFDAYAGLPGAETLGTLLYSEGVAQSRIGLDTFLEVLCSGPADIFGFSRKGRIRVGNDADLVVFDPEAEWTLDESAMHYQVGWSPFHGHEVKGRVEATYIRGGCVYRDGDVVGPPGTGQFIRPG